MVFLAIVRGVLSFIWRLRQNHLRRLPVSTLKIEVSCSKETYELGKGVAEFIGAIKVALADGWQLGNDMPVIVSAALATLVPAVDGVTKVKEELAQDKKAFLNAASLTGAAVLSAIL